MPFLVNYLEIYQVKKELTDLGHQEDEFFTLYPNMILL